MKFAHFVFLLLCCFTTLLGKGKYTTVLSTDPEEKWWGGMIAYGSNMPYESNIRLTDLSEHNYNNQAVPLMLSSKGRYVWSDRPFRFDVKEKVLTLYSDTEQLQPVKAGNSLREAYRAASAAHFPPSGVLPDSLLFSMPQYNTWIELMYNQNQADILNYAAHVIDNGYPAGVFMIDDNWQKYYGNFDFKPDRFPDPKAMISQLHNDGFKIMLWISPYVSADSPEFRELTKKGYLIRRKGSNEPAIMYWWNGYSACYDLSNPAAVEHLTAQLTHLQQEYGVDGYKFDAGDINLFNGELAFHDTTATANDMCMKWAELGLAFPFNEYRACWKMGGQALVQRLGDKDYSWNAVKLLIPEMTGMGLMGYAYGCPDMIGGGQFTAFKDVRKGNVDERLIVRSCQIHALMPMMQFSVAPWRILSDENNAICAKYAQLHKQMGPYILQLARESAKSGEPIVRNMEYSFPHQGLADCKDQFMLGDKYLVAPVVDNGDRRTVRLPKGRWMDDRGKVFRGPKTIEIDAPLNRLPYFERMIQTK